MADFRQPRFWTSLLKKIITIIFRNLGGRSGPPSHVQHVVPHPEGWAVRGEGNERYTAVYKYQDDAIDRAKEVARNYGSSVVIHREDGTIRDRISYRERD
ncbi:MAG: DUF2188 domain-containing protein [Lewinella sp.]|nr:DUF2188 domain-containing protein [Lewinella sp.]